MVAVEEQQRLVISLVAVGCGADCGESVARLATVNLLVVALHLRNSTDRRTWPGRDGNGRTAARRQADWRQVSLVREIRGRRGGLRIACSGGRAFHGSRRL